jgi:nucleoside-diphosphate-sugar epimerase
MKILFTGASSFTGFWFVKTLATSGCEVVCPLRGTLDNYEGVRRRRTEKLQTLCRFVPSAAFGSENFLKLAREEKFDVLCHHAAELSNYKSPDFDAVAALASNTLNVRMVLKSLKCPAVLTGSVFENDEGIDPHSKEADAEGLRAFSPYGLSKGMTYQIFRHYCFEAGVPLGKFVIPNPFGPFEEPRFTAHLMKHWSEGKVAEVKTPHYLRDNIHVDLLAEIYGQFVSRATTMKSGAKSNPSGYVETQGAFAQRVAREVKNRTSWACELKLAKQEDFNEPLNRINTEPAIKTAPKWNERKAWDSFVGYYKPDGK